MDFLRNILSNFCINQYQNTKFKFLFFYKLLNQPGQLTTINAQHMKRADRKVIKYKNKADNFTDN